MPFGLLLDLVECHKQYHGMAKPKREKGNFKRGLAMFWSFLKGYRILTFLTPFTILLDVYIELKLPEIMGRVTDYIMYHAGTDSFVRHDLNMLLLEMLGYTLLGILVTTLTLGICLPWAYTMIYNWEIKHTLVSGHRLAFDGTAIGLFGQWIKWLLLTIITLGIYGLWVGIKLKKWKVSHTKILF